ncbi:hypothetical protein BJF93_05440 [Xaviernesmea oryzae]|uniref:Uncharacterized protein n=1 Tax=Xaviernesmea oryzae TaxID=464029 RepID=A0A1Q9ARM7_9HYPH|nr:hypothetical protein [Xaviernesmea oryzae]OLP58077.1 hypothetical protein BJF93_05440 [Xaviernesmea oryzae]SEL83478.1 hypothetical protein SAMN04487976_113117 [Xaviernesmea oryzae]
MNERFDPNDKRPTSPSSWPADQAAANAGAPRTAPLGTTATSDPLLNSRPMDPDAPMTRPRSNWPILIILLAGLVLALLLWLPGGNSNNDTATQPAAPAATQATPPADQATPPAATQGATNNGATTTAPATDTPATPPAATPPAATGTNTGTPATGNGTTTGTDSGTSGTGTSAPATGNGQ